MSACQSCKEIDISSVVMVWDNARYAVHEVSSFNVVEQIRQVVEGSVVKYLNT